MKENYPKYIIPYTPICMAVLTGVLILPLCVRLDKRLTLLAGSASAIAVFFILLGVTAGIYIVLERDSFLTAYSE